MDRVIKSESLFDRLNPLNLSGVVASSHPQRQADLGHLYRGIPTSREAASLHGRSISVMADVATTASQDELFVVCIGEPYWSTSGQAASAVEIGTQYRKAGISLLDQLAGHFMILITDGEEIHAAVDRFAREPLYWAGDDHGITLGSSADALTTASWIERELSSQSLYHYLYYHMIPAPDSVYRGVQKLQAAHRLSWRPGKLTVGRYWQPQFQAARQAKPDDLYAGLLDALGTAVERATGDQDTGSFLSGGLDSSTVSGLLAGAQPGAHAYSIGFDAAGYDEITYARTAAKHFGLTGHEYYVTPDDILAALPKVAEAYDEPFGNSSALPALFCALCAAADGRQRLLAGDGGDELFAGNARYAKQAVFEHYQRLPGWARSTLKASTTLLPRISVAGKAKSYVEQASIPLPDRLQTYNFLHRLPLSQMFHSEFLAEVDTQQPLHLARELFAIPVEADTLDRMLYLDWHHTLADNDLRKVGRMCALAGISVRYPMLDDVTVNHSLSVPSDWKLKGSRLRHFYKQATSDFLPKQILDKPKQGFGLPFGVWMTTHPGLAEMASDTLARLRRRRLLAVPFIDELIRLHRDEHAAYYGELIWVAVMLELWLTSHGFEP